MPKSSCSSSGDKTIFEMIGEYFNPPEPKKSKKSKKHKKHKKTKKMKRKSNSNRRPLSRLPARYSYYM